MSQLPETEPLREVNMNATTSTSKKGRKRKRPVDDDDEEEEWVPTEQEEKEESADGNASDDEWTPAPKRRRTNSGKAKSGKKGKKKKSARAPTLTKKKVGEYKKELNGYVRHFAKQVNLDWHDGWEEQGETLGEWFAALEAPLNTIYEFAIIHKRDYDRCNEIMKIIVDTFDNIHAVPMRGDIDETLMESDHSVSVEFKQIDEKRTFSSSSIRRELISQMWALLLTAAAASELTDDEIYRFIKDASDNGVTLFTHCENNDEENIIPKHTHLADGVTRLEALVEKKPIWDKLPTTKKVHRMRRAIDRRFDGELHLRTRDYHLMEDDCFLF